MVSYHAVLVIPDTEGGVVQRIHNILNSNLDECVTFLNIWFYAQGKGYLGKYIVDSIETEFHDLI